MKQTRRSVLGAAGALIAGTAGASHVLADSHMGIEIKVHAEEEYVVLKNTTDEDINLSGYTINFEYANPNKDQIKTFEERTVLEAGGQLVVATGKLDVPNADVTFESDNHLLHNEDPDAVAVLNPDGDVVASTNFNTTTTTTTTEKAETTETTTEESEETTTEEDSDGGSEGDGGDGEPASVTLDDQNSDGASVIVQHATLSDGGFIVIHDESGAVLGHSTHLDAGDHSNVEVSLDNPITSTQTLIAMAHTDDGDETYEFPDADGPYTAEGAPVTDDAHVTVVC